jgi:tetratricopeptide (TPR) repeat protein
MYFETDPALSEDLILAFGRKLRTQYYKNIGRYVDAIELVDQREFYDLHADFCSRLGMTFSHGDYANEAAIEDKERIAEKLFTKALGYSPDQRAYLGLGIIKQRSKDFNASIRTLSEGLTHFPYSEELHLCLGISYMNVEEYQKALSHLLKFQHSKNAAYYIAHCYKALGDSEKEEGFLKKLNAFQ